MKIRNNKAILLLVMGIIASCNEGIDPISAVDPGPDVTAPTVAITSPSGSVVNIPFTETQVDLAIDFTAADDIEIKKITLKLDGTTLSTYDSFTDYRRVVKSFMTEKLGIGDHRVEVVAEDLSGKITILAKDFEVSNQYTAKYAGEIFYMPFEGNLNLDLISLTSATVVGTPSFATGKSGKAYAGATDSYLTYPIAGLGLANSFSISFWYKANIVPDRAGIMVIGPPGINTRTSGFRLFREGGASPVKGNIGTGAGDVWNDGGAISSTAWVFMTLVVGEGKYGIYANGTLLRAESTYTGNISWADCEFLSIGSGAPRFIEWGHLSDNSLIDEIRIFNKKLTQAEVQAVMNGN